MSDNMEEELPLLDVEEEQEEEEEEQEKRAPALTIQIQSWATPIVGLLMLVIGLGAGYFGRPYISPDQSSPPVVAALPENNAAVNAPASTESPTADAATRKEMMDYLIAQTHHFKGDPEAPVTLIEFSDYQ